MPHPLGFAERRAEAGAGSSGAIGVGMGKLGLPQRPEETEKKQALAAIGQCELMFLYDKFFGEYDHTVAQVLLTADVVDFPRGRENVQNTLPGAALHGGHPGGERERHRGDPRAGGQELRRQRHPSPQSVAGLCGAQGLVILTDIDGLYDSDPRKNPQARRIPRVEEITPAVEELAGALAPTVAQGAWPPS